MSRSFRQKPSQAALQTARTTREPMRSLRTLWNLLIDVSEFAVRQHYHAPWKDSAR